MRPSAPGAAEPNGHEVVTRLLGYDVRLLFEQALLAESDLIRLQARLFAVASRLGFREDRIERLRLVAAELATNQSKYGGGRGLLQAWEVRLGARMAIDLFAIDYGVGIANLGMALRDGYSSGGTLGKGLGAATRLASRFAVLTRTASSAQVPWHGTAAWARFEADAGAGADDLWDLGLYRRSYQDARENGDGFALCVGTGIQTVHLDALGHGREAAALTDAARGTFSCARSLAENLAAIERLAALRRGAAVCAYACDASGALTWSGAGDMQACLLQNNTRVSLGLGRGVYGHVHGHLPTKGLEWVSGGLLVTASDGLRSSWPQGLAELAGHPPQLLAYFLGQVWGRTNDDRSCLVVRRV